MMYDLAILGGGPAGYSAAFEAAKNGLSVVLFENDKIGGTCLNRGCIPTKFLVHTSEILYQIKNSSRYGITVDKSTLDFATTVGEMDSRVQQLRDGLTEQLVNAHINIVRGTAILTDNNNVKCKSENYSANYILLSTGSNPAKPIIEGASNSDDALALKHIPKSVKIIGGGVIAIEFANVFNKLGSNVTINIRGERILQKWDKDLAVSVIQNLKKDGVKIKIKCSLEDFKEGNYDFVLSATGRVPRTEAFMNIGIECDNNSAVIVDDNGKTNLENIYAAGDVISGSTMLAHTAMEQGRRVVWHIVGNKKVDQSAVANCMYLSPEVVYVGMTEAEAKAEGLEVVAGKVNMASNAMTLFHTDKRSFIKVIVEKTAHRILGAQLMCERASDISSEFVVAINNKLTVEDIRNSVHPHPSFSEAIFDVMTVLEKKLNGI